MSSVPSNSRRNGDVYNPHMYPLPKKTIPKVL